MKIVEILTESWSQKYKNSINCSHPKGFSQKAHCAGKKKRNESIEMEAVCPDCGMCETHGNHEHNHIDEACWKGYHKDGMKTMFGKQYPNCKKNKTESLERYVREGICPGCGGHMVAEGLLNEKQDACYHKVKSRYKVWPSAYASGALVQCRKKGAANWGNTNENIDELDENLRDWFGKEKWVRMDTKGNIKGDCARGSESEGKPKCLPQAKAQSLGKKGRASAAQRKRREDPNPERSGKAINVNTKKQSNEGVAEGSQRVDSLVTDALKLMRGSNITDAVQALKTVLGDREFSSRRNHYNFYIRQMMDMYSQQGLAEEFDLIENIIEGIAAQKKRREDPNPERSGAAINVATKVRKESLDSNQKRVGQVGSEEQAKPIGQVLGKSTKQHPFKGRLVGEGEEGSPEGVEHLTKELLQHIVQQVGTEGAHAVIKSLTWGDGAAKELLHLIVKDLEKNIKQGVAEGYGRYYCSTDKRWKERKGPKQTRSS